MLTNIQCKNAQPKHKPYKIAAGRGLYLEVMPNGSKYWRMKYRIKVDGKLKEKRIAFGVYPETSLREADEKCTEARKLLDQNLDPSSVRKRTKRAAEINSGDTFEALARKWHENFKHKWTDRHAKTVIHRLERDIFPEFGPFPVNEIKPFHVIDALKKVQKRGANEPAHRLRQYCSQVFRYAIIHELTDSNPAAEIGMVLQPRVKGHYACIESREIPELLKALNFNNARLHTDTRLAIQLLMLTFVRTKELIEAKWDEFDLENSEWIIPAERMKMRNEHIVPLSNQAVALLQDLKERNEKWDWVFPGHHSPRKHMSNNTVLKGLERLGFKGRMTGHGFRALAMSTIKEKLGYRHEVVDRQLAHAPQSMVQRAYDRAQFLDERKKMMQEWADYIDSLKLA
ncbi:MAG: tyrosine-type recombinase/integrase [Alphaproteobacteria bacterium]|nr:tyrosine-type recombinase/integrase [Alphaproteobacteria bacterium]